jgi:hypothetical protein
MAIFNQNQLIAKIERIRIQKEILPLSTVFTTEQKEVMLEAYKTLSIIYNEALVNLIEVKEPTYQ